MDICEINGVQYPVKKYIKVKEIGSLIPLLDMPMMSDETWNSLYEEQKGGKLDGIKP